MQTNSPSSCEHEATPMQYRNIFLTIRHVHSLIYQNIRSIYIYIVHQWLANTRTKHNMLYIETGCNTPDFFDPMESSILFVGTSSALGIGVAAGIGVAIGFSARASGKSGGGKGVSRLASWASNSPSSSFWNSSTLDVWESSCLNSSWGCCGATEAWVSSTSAPGVDALLGFQSWSGKSSTQVQLSIYKLSLHENGKHVLSMAFETMFFHGLIMAISRVWEVYRSTLSQSALSIFIYIYIY